MVSSVKFLMVYPNIQYNQIYKLYYIYNQNDNQVYNEIYTDNLC